jgi:hypothetical protein
MNSVGLLILSKQNTALQIAKAASADLGPARALDSVVQGFTEAVDDLLNGTTPEDPKVPEVRAILEAARKAVLSATSKAKVQADYDKATRTIAVAGPALIVACDLLDAMLDETYPS